MNMFDVDKTRMIGLPSSGETMRICCHFHLIPERDGQTDGQNCYRPINSARPYADAR